MHFKKSWMFLFHQTENNLFQFFQIKKSVQLKTHSIIFSYRMDKSAKKHFSSLRFSIIYVIFPLVLNDCLVEDVMALVPVITDHSCDLGDKT